MESRTIGSHDDGGPWAPTVYTLQPAAQARTDEHMASLPVSAHAHLVTCMRKIKKIHRFLNLLYSQFN